MTDKLNVAVIGLGNMGRHHAKNYHNIDTANLVAVCDKNPDTVENFSREYHCNGYTSLDAMIANETLDAVSVVAPTFLHYEIAKTLIKNDINLLIEKPICDNVEKAKELVTLSQERDLTLMVGHIERFNPAVAKLKSLIDSDRIGKITSLIGKRVGIFPSQIKDANVIIDLAVHDIDIFSYLLNKQPDNVYANSGRALVNGREDYAELFLTYGDQNTFIQVNWITPIRIRNLAITGTRGYAELNYMTQELVFYESNYSKEVDPLGEHVITFSESKKEVIPVEKKAPLEEELRHFLDCVKTKRTPLITGDHGLNALSIAIQAMKQMNMALFQAEKCS